MRQSGQNQQTINDEEGENAPTHQQNREDEIHIIFPFVDLQASELFLHSPHIAF